MRVLLTLAVLAGLLWAVPTPYYVLEPGEAVAAASLVRVPAPPRGPGAGTFYILTVRQYPANVFTYLRARLDPERRRLEFRTDVIGPYEEPSAYWTAMWDLADQSRQLAAAAGLRAAGKPVRVEPRGVRLVHLMQDSPARGVLREGDTVLAVNGRPVRGSGDLIGFLRDWPPGEPVRLRVRRDSQELELTVPTTGDPHRPGAAIRAVIHPQYQVELPVAVEVSRGSFAGPSAGLMLSLEVYRQVTGIDITGGRKVAGTGEIGPAGEVLPVGSIPQKVWAAVAAGADVMLVPAGQIEEARQVGASIELVPVGSVAEAVSWLQATCQASVTVSPETRR